MTVLDDLRTLEQMTAEELLIAAAAPGCNRLYAERCWERVVEMHQPLVREIARRYRYRGEPYEDLLQAAYV
ncbi:sigma factor, partial [Thermocatellispora tengchongensis]